MASRRSLRRALPLLALAGCTADAPGWAGTIETLAGGGRRVLNPAQGLWAAGTGWRLEPELRIGGVESEGPDLFARIGALQVDGLGRIWLIESQANEVRVFDAAGVHVRSFGRRGTGPGEFHRPGGLVFDARGDLWIPDAGNRRYSRWDTAGAEIESRPMDTRAMHFVFVGALMPDGQLYDVDTSPAADGGLAVSPLLAAAGLGGGGEILRPVLRVDEGPLTGDTIDVPSLDDPPATFSVPGMALGVPFSPSVCWLLDPRGWLWHGTTDVYRVVRRSLAGDTSLAIEREYDPLPVTSADIDEWLQGTGPQRILQAGGTIDRSRIPHVKPIFDDLIVDDAGYVWIRLMTNDPGSRFDVFDVDGRYLGAVVSPDPLLRIPRPVIRGDAFYGVMLDAMDVPHVVRYRVVRAPR